MEKDHRIKKTWFRMKLELNGSRTELFHQACLKSQNAPGTSRSLVTYRIASSHFKYCLYLEILRSCFFFPWFYRSCAILRTRIIYFGQLCSFYMRNPVYKTQISYKILASRGRRFKVNICSRKKKIKI